MFSIAPIRPVPSSIPTVITWGYGWHSSGTPEEPAGLAKTEPTPPGHTPDSDDLDLPAQNERTVFARLPPLHSPLNEATDGAE